MYSVFGKGELSECEACSMVSGWLISPSSAISLRRVPTKMPRVVGWGLKAEYGKGVGLCFSRRGLVAGCVGQKYEALSETKCRTRSIG